MAHVYSTPPSVETMLEIFVRWMAHHSRTKITMKIEYHDGTYKTTTIDYLGHKIVETPDSKEEANACHGRPIMGDN